MSVWDFLYNLIYGKLLSNPQEVTVEELCKLSKFIIAVSADYGFPLDTLLMCILKNLGVKEETVQEVQVQSSMVLMELKDKLEKEKS